MRTTINPADISFLGTSMDRSYPDGRRVHLSLAANPSHLEAVNPIVIGKVRAKQFYSGQLTDRRCNDNAWVNYMAAAY
jgi:2-oxoglutarate dehydrogenase complex dehydrogenase (E1) component-like enzyme